MARFRSDARAAESPLRDPVIRGLALIVVLGSVMSVLDTTIVNVAIETLSRDFKAPISTIQWVTTGYLLALAIVIPMTGWIVDRFGSRRSWMVSIVLFTVGSALCGMAWSTGSLIAFRVVQGIGGGLIMPIGQSVLARAAGPARMGRMMSIIGIPTMLAPVLGPVIGGLIVSSLSWRWIFFVNVPIGVVALLLSLRRLDQDDRRDPGRFDFLGLALVSPGLAALLYGLSEAGGGDGLADPVVIGSLVAGVLLVGAFVLHARRAARPLLEVRLFAERSFSVANLAVFLVVAAVYGAMFLLPLYYQILRGESALTAGLLMAPQGIGAMLSLPLGGRLTDRFGPGRVVPVGMAVVTLATLIYTQVGPSTAFGWLALSLFVRGLGMGWTMMPTSASAYRRLAHEAVPKATTALNIVIRVGGSFGTALVAVVLQRQIDGRLPQLSQILSSGLGTEAGRPTGHVAAELGSSFGYAFWVVMVMTAVGFFASLLLPRTGVAQEGLLHGPAPNNEPVRPAPAPGAPSPAPADLSSG